MKRRCVLTVFGSILVFPKNFDEVFQERTAETPTEVAPSSFIPATHCVVTHKYKEILILIQNGVKHLFYPKQL